MKYFLSSRDHPTILPEDICIGTFKEFKQWTDSQIEYQLDTETTIPPNGPNEDEDRELVCLQLGDVEEDIQWLIDWIDLDIEYRNYINKLLSSNITVYIHNAMFDFKVLYRSVGCTLVDVHDTFLMSKILNTGYTHYAGYHSLSHCLNRFLDISLDKTEQKGFNTTDIFTISQIRYACKDVMFVKLLFDKLKDLLESWDLWYLYNEIERKVLIVYATMELTKMRFDVNHWTAMANGFIQEKADILVELNQALFSDPELLEKLKDPNNGLKESLIQPKDKSLISWGSTIHRNKILQYLIPYLPETCKTKPDLVKWFKSKMDNMPEEDILIMQYYIDRKYDEIENYLLTYHKEWLLENELFLAKDSVLLNWNSSTHKLLVFQHYYPKLQNTDAKALDKIKVNPLINAFKKYTKAQKKVSSYGLGFIDNYVRRDGTISMRDCKQILTTGRISAGILLQIPASAMFRNAFYPPEGRVFVDSDLKSAELIIISMAANESAFKKAIEEDKDVHSMAASLIFGAEWTDGAEPGCSWMIDGSKCECPKHEKLRKFSKTISFGLIYGLSAHGLSDRLNITKTEAAELIEKYFSAFSNLRQYLSGTENFGKDNLYIRGMAPTNRIRFFSEPKYQSDLEAIGRESKNFPIQEACASILKLALIYLYNYIKDNNLTDKVSLHLPVHDEVLSSCVPEIAEEWLAVQEKLMMDAAEVFLGCRILGTDSKITDKWTK